MCAAATTLSWLRSRFSGTGFLGSFVSVRLTSVLATSACLGTQQRTLPAPSAFQ
jgi:uncharacterized membrane protein